MLVIQKLYFILGLLSIGAAMLVPGMDVLAFGGLFAMAAGTMQSYVRVPIQVRAIALVVYVLGVCGVLVGSEVAELAGTVLVFVVLAVHIVGVLRFAPQQTAE